MKNIVALNRSILQSARSKSQVCGPTERGKCLIPDIFPISCPLVIFI